MRESSQSPLKGEASLLAFAAHRERKQAEEDAIRLQNRIRKLNAEKERAEKLIEQTRRKAEELQKIKARNDKMREERDKLRAERRRQLEMQKRDNERRRAEIEATKAQAAQSLHNLKRQTVRMTREERRLNEDFVSYSKEQDHAQNVQRKLDVLTAEREKDAKLRGKLASIEQNALDDAARRRNHELTVKGEVEGELSRLAQLEAALIDGLKQQQLEQQAALERLEAELTDSRRAVSAAGTRRSIKSPASTGRLTSRGSPEPMPIGSAYRFSPSR